MSGDDAFERDLASLVAAGDLAGAAEFARASGHHARASRLYEQGCVFGEAARSALMAGDLRGAVRLAALADDESLDGVVVAAGAAHPEELASLARTLDARRFPRFVARLLEASGDVAAAASAFEAAGDALAAARCLRRASDDLGAARVLEGALREEDADAPEDLRVALAELYLDHGRHDAAVRLAQRVSGGPMRHRALAVLEASFVALGLERPLADVRAERRKIGPREGDDGLRREHGPSATGARTGQVLVGRYAIVRTVAETPHARVLEAVDRIDGRRVALKLLGSSLGASGRDAAMRFTAEAQALAKLRHPHIVPLRDAHTEPPLIVLEWMEGGSLADLLARVRLSPARAVEIARAVLEALSAAHRIGVVHRDLKPSNVLFDGGGTPKLADFGAAHLSGANATMTAGAIGTLGYMAPEQRRGEPATPASDLYAVGVLLHEMLALVLPPRPGAAEATADTVRAAVTHPDLDARHDRILARLLADEPQRRPSSAREAAVLLEGVAWSPRVVGGLRVASEAHDPRPATPMRLRRTGSVVYPGAEGGRDLLLERDVAVIEGTPEVRRRAAAWSAAASRTLATIWRVDSDHGALWCELPRGRAVRDDGLAPTERRALEDALRELHAHGACHGAIDGLHVVRTSFGVRLVFPAGGRLDATLDDELAALETLGREGDEDPPLR